MDSVWGEATLCIGNRSMRRGTAVYFVRQSLVIRLIRA